MPWLHEIIFLLFSAAEVMMDSLTKAFIVDTLQQQSQLSNRTDLSTGNRSHSERDSTALEEQVATYLMVNQVCLYLPWVVLAIFVGVWSDRHGRKPLMVLPCAAHVLSVLIYQLTSYVPGHLTAVVVGGALIRGVIGKQAMFGNITNRVVITFAILLGFRYIGAFLGNLLGGFLLDIIGVKYTMLMSAGMHAVCLMAVLVAVKETVHWTPSTLQRKDDCRDAKKKTEDKPRRVFSRCFERRNNRSHKDRGDSEDEEETPMLSEKDTGERAGRYIHTRNIDNWSSESITYGALRTADTIANIDLGYTETTLGTHPQHVEIIRPVDSGNVNNITHAVLGDTEDAEPLGSNERIADQTPTKGEDDSPKESLENRSGTDIENGASDPKRNLLTCGVILFVAFVTQSIWTSHREVIVQSVSAPPLQWPVSSFGYLYAAYYGAGGLGLIAITPLISKLTPPTVDQDFGTLVFALLNGIVSTLWIGFAVTWNSKWQVYAAFALAALSLLSNSSLRSMLSGSVRADQQGKAMAVMSVKENLSKVLGPVFHTFVLVLSLPACPALVYYVMSGETCCMLVVAIVMQLCLRQKTAG